MADIKLFPGSASFGFRTKVDEELLKKFNLQKSESVVENKGCH